MSEFVPLTDEQRAAREERLEAKHKEFLRAVTSSHSLPNQQSSTAGAGGTTNQKLRVAEDHEAERLLRMKLAAQAAAKEKKAQNALDERSRALQAKQLKKKSKREKKLSHKKEDTSRRIKNSDDELASSADEEG